MANTRKVTLTHVRTNRAAPMYRREGWKQLVAVPHTMFDGAPPATLTVTSTFAAEPPAKVRRKSKVRQMLAALPEEQRKAMRKAMREAQRRVLAEAGLVDADKATA